jgi:hypothetical protein
MCPIVKVIIQLKYSKMLYHKNSIFWPIVKN